MLNFKMIEIVILKVLYGFLEADIQFWFGIEGDRYFINIMNCERKYKLTLIIERNNNSSIILFLSM